MLEFFETSTRNVLAAEAAAGVRHHVALSVVGTERLSDSGYFRAKIAQEKLIEDSSISYSIVHATQFFEFVNRIADTATSGNTVRLAHVLIQPTAAEDVASTVADVTVGPPVNGIFDLNRALSWLRDNASNVHVEISIDAVARDEGLTESSYGMAS